MCSRYALSQTRDDIELRFGVSLPVEFAPMAEVRPTNRALVIDGENGARLLRWGFEVDWDSAPLFNARTETLAEKPTFRGHLQQRCLVPADGYFEWRKGPRSKIKTRITRNQGDLFAFAGLMDGDRFTIVTCPPAPEIAFVHGRMPVILPRDAESLWISDASFTEVAPLLKPYAEVPLTAMDAAPPPAQQELF